MVGVSENCDCFALDNRIAQMTLDAEEIQVVVGAVVIAIMQVEAVGRQLFAAFCIEHTT